jgi:hypothetical protein
MGQGYGCKNKIKIDALEEVEMRQGCNTRVILKGKASNGKGPGPRGR